MEDKYLEEALSYYNIAVSDVTLLRHNENLTYRIGSIGELSHRQKIAEGYRDAGGTINYEALDACFVLNLLDCLGIHFEQWSKQDWFELRMNRWYKESFGPYVRGERLFDDDFYLSPFSTERSTPA